MNPDYLLKSFMLTLCTTAFIGLLAYLHYLDEWLFTTCIIILGCVAIFSGVWYLFYRGFEGDDDEESGEYY